MDPIVGSNATTTRGSRGDDARGSQFLCLRRSLVKLMRNLHQFSARATVGSSHEGTHEDGTRSRGRGRRQNYALVKFLRTFRPSHSSQENETAVNTAASTPPGARPVSLPGFESTIYNKLSHHSRIMSMPEIYSRLLLRHRHGFPLYQPESDMGLPFAYRKRGISIGDVGMVTEDGSFDFLFNICPSRSDANPSQLPDNFEQVQSDDSSVRQCLQPKTHLFSDDVDQVSDSPPSYRCSAHEGAVLELPKGALLYEAQNRYPFRDLAARHAYHWYKYMIINKSRDAPNGSLYVVTGCVKAKHWGISVFDRPSAPQDYLQFVADDPGQDQDAQQTFDWKRIGAVITKIGLNALDVNTADDEEPNQCLFVRGYRVMIRQPIWEMLMRGETMNDGAAASTSEDETQWGSDSAATLKNESERVMLKENFNSPLIHPSDSINTMLLQLEIRAKVALTHDDEWCATLPDKFASSESHLKVDELRKNVSESYTRSVNEHGGVFLVSKTKPKNASEISPEPANERTVVSNDKLGLPETPSSPVR